MEERMKFKYREDVLLSEFDAYIRKTYSKHYAEEDGSQTIDKIIAKGYGTGFFMGNVFKYSDRYGKKDGFNRDDLMKTLHYTLLMLYLHDRDHGQTVSEPAKLADDYLRTTNICMPQDATALWRG